MSALRGLRPRPGVERAAAGGVQRAALLAWSEPLIDEAVALGKAGNRVIELR